MLWAFVNFKCTDLFSFPDVYDYDVMVEPDFKHEIGNRSVGFSGLLLKWISLVLDWDKSGIFSDQISLHFGSPSQNVMKLILKKFQMSHLGLI